jgi:CBS-domain-containing membrane protein
MADVVIDIKISRRLARKIRDLCIGDSMSDFREEDVEALQEFGEWLDANNQDTDSLFIEIEKDPK